MKNGGKCELTTVCVILNYNDSKTTISLLSNIQYFQELDYIVIVDNKSTDDSYEQLKQYSNEKVHVILTERNGGYGYGNNFGIWYSYNHLGATEVLIANPDVIFSAECVKALKLALLEKKDCAIVAPVMVNEMGKRDILTAWKIPTMAQDVLWASPTINKLFGSKMLYQPEYFENKDWCFVDIVPGSLFMVNAKIMTDIGMYDEEFFLYGEEKLLGYKLKQKGYKTLLLLNQSYIHKKAESINKSFNLIAKHKLFLESKLLFLRKYYNVTGVRLLMIKMFFKLTLLETYIISLIKKLYRKKEYNELLRK